MIKLADFIHSSNVQHILILWKVHCLLFIHFIFIYMQLLV